MSVHYSKVIKCPELFKSTTQKGYSPEFDDKMWLVSKGDYIALRKHCESESDLSVELPFLLGQYCGLFVSNAMSEILYCKSLSVPETVSAAFELVESGYSEKECHHFWLAFDNALSLLEDEYDTFVDFIINCSNKPFAHILLHRYMQLFIDQCNFLCKHISNLKCYDEHLHNLDCEDALDSGDLEDYLPKYSPTFSKAELYKLNNCANCSQEKVVF